MPKQTAFCNHKKGFADAVTESGKDGRIQKGFKSFKMLENSWRHLRVFPSEVCGPATIIDTFNTDLGRAYS